MKTRSILTLASSALLLLSCMNPLQEDGCRVELTIDLGTATRASNYTTELPAESSVRSVAYYVFDSQGRLEATASSSGLSAVTVSVRTGSKTVWAAVNIPASRFSGVTTLQDFESKEVSFRDFSADLFPMAGRKAVTIGNGGVSLSIPVERFVSRICVAEVRNRLAGSLAGKSMTVRSCYLTNVPGNSRITGAAPASQLWYNRFGRRDGGGEADIISSASDASFSGFTFAGIGSTVQSGRSVTPLAFLYFFPNPATSDATGWASTFTPRYTRIVTVIEIDGKTYYYPVSITGNVRNHAYTLYLTVTHLGTHDPDNFEYDTTQDVTIDIGGFDDFGDDFEIIY